MTPDGTPKGSGVVAFETPEDAQNAIQQFNGYDWSGRLLEVREDRFAGGGGYGRGGFGGRGGFAGGYGRGGFDGARVALHDLRTGEQEHLRADAVLGCDGAHSTVRDVVGAVLRDLHFTERWLVVDARCELGEAPLVDALDGQAVGPGPILERPEALQLGGVGGDHHLAADVVVDAALAAAGPLVGEGGLIYVEAPREIAAPAGFSVLRQGRAGTVHFHLLRREDNPGS